MNSLASATLLCVGERVVGRRCAILVLTRLLGREVRVYDLFPLMAEVPRTSSRWLGGCCPRRGDGE
jgi:hypothetical protein